MCLVKEICEEMCFSISFNTSLVLKFGVSLLIRNLACAVRYVLRRTSAP